MQSIVIIEYDLATWMITRIIHPEDDSQLIHHIPESGWGQILVPHYELPINQITGKPLYSLSACADYVQKTTGRRPPNG